MWDPSRLIKLRVDGGIRGPSDEDPYCSGHNHCFVSYVTLKGQVGAVLLAMAIAARRLPAELERAQQQMDSRGVEPAIGSLAAARAALPAVCA